MDREKLTTTLHGTSTRGGSKVASGLFLFSGKITRILLISFFLLACASPPNPDIESRLSSDNREGYVEFYCMRCMTGWSVFKMEGEKQVNLTQQIIGRKLADSVEMPSREKRVRIPLSVGIHELTIHLLPYTLVGSVFDVKNGASIKISLLVKEDHLTPVRLNFTRISNHSFSWAIKQGEPIPLSENADTVETLLILLKSSDWDTRWYATQFLGNLRVSMPKLAIVRLEELSGQDALQDCFKKATVVECERLRETAEKTLKKITVSHP